MWNDCGQGTIACIADGIRTLASIWQAAVGKDATWLANEPKIVGETDLMPIYEDLAFLPSLHLGNYTQAMIPGSDAPASGRPRASASPASKPPASRRQPGRKPAVRPAAKPTRKRVKAPA
jgi:hypothetical protein